MGRMNLTLTGETFTDLLLSDVGASAFKLDHDWWIQEDLTITTATGGGGTVLSEGADYLISEESEDDAVTGIPGLSTRVTAAVGATRHVYKYITIINATYQTGDLYFSGKYVGDDNEAPDIEDRGIKAVSSANLTIRDDDGYGRILVTTGASDRTITLPTAADNERRLLTIVKADSGAGEVIIDGEGGETIEGFTTVRLVKQYDSLTILCNGSGWLRVAGAIVPNAAEESMGSPRWRGDSSTAVAIFAQNPMGIGTWWDVTFSEVPSGAKAAWARVNALGGAGNLDVRKKGDTVARGYQIRVLSTITAAGHGVVARFPLDETKTAQISTDQATGGATIYEAVYYERL